MRSDHDTSSFDQWLDGLVRGESTPVGRTSESTRDTTDLQAAARQIHDLAALADGRAHDPPTGNRLDQIWEKVMSSSTNATSAGMVSPPPASYPRWAVPPGGRRHWQGVINTLVAAALVLGLGFGAWQTFSGMQRQGGSDPGGERTGQLAPGTPVTEATPSSFVPALPTAADCTVTALTIDEVVGIVEGAHVPTREDVVPTVAPGEGMEATVVPPTLESNPGSVPTEAPALGDVPPTVAPMTGEITPTMAPADLFIQPTVTPLPMDAVPTMAPAGHLVQPTMTRANTLEDPASTALPPTVVPEDGDVPTGAQPTKVPEGGGSSPRQATLDDVSASHNMWMACVKAESWFQVWAMTDPSVVAEQVQMLLPHVGGRENLVAALTEIQETGRYGDILGSPMDLIANRPVTIVVDPDPVNSLEPAPGLVVAGYLEFDEQGNLLASVPAPDSASPMGWSSSFVYGWNAERGTWLVHQTAGLIG